MDWPVKRAEEKRAVVDTVASSYIATTSSKAGGAAEAAESRKQRKYKHLEDRFIVQPVGFETLGSWGPAARSFRVIGHRLSGSASNGTGKIIRIFATEDQHGNSTRTCSICDGKRGDVKRLGQIFFAFILIFWAMIWHILS